MTWRDDAKEVIHAAIPEVEQRASDAVEIFNIIRREYYPFGERAQWPYKVWLSEINVQRDFYNKIKNPPPMEKIDYNTGLFEATP